MEEQPKFKMIRKKADGRLFPYSDVLAQADGFEVLEMTKAQILKGQKATLQGSEVKKRVSLGDVKTRRSDKPGPGWFKNNYGTWQRRKKK